MIHQSFGVWSDPSKKTCQGDITDPQQYTAEAPCVAAGGVFTTSGHCTTQAWENIGEDAYNKRAHHFQRSLHRPPTFFQIGALFPPRYTPRQLPPSKMGGLVVPGTL